MTLNQIMGIESVYQLIGSSKVPQISHVWMKILAMREFIAG
jgi:hypothetical protein